MRNIPKIFRRDIANVSRSVIGVIVAVGLVIIPCLYAWFNIAGSWDPYGNTGNLKVAVANEDAGYKSDLVPIEVNIGETVESSLHANDQLDWVFVDGKDDAIEGVKRGDYYAAVVIPESFSASMMTLFSNEVEHAQISYYENQKANAIAPRVTDTGANAIREQIDETFTQTITNVGLSVTSSLLDYMDSDEVSNYVTHLSSTLGTGIASLRSAARDTGTYAQLLGSTSSLVSNAGSLLGSSDTSSSGTADLLADAQSGLSSVKDGLGEVSSAVNEALSNSKSSFDEVGSAVDAALTSGRDEIDLTAGQLEDVSGTLSKKADQLQTVLERVEQVMPGAEAVQSEIQSLIDLHRNLASTLSSTASDLRSGVSTVDSDLTAVKEALTAGKQSIAGVQGDFETTLKGKADKLRESVGGVASSAEGISASLNETVDGLSRASDSLAADLQKVNGNLGDASAALVSSADALQQLKDDLDAAVQSGDLARIRSLIGSDPAALADALAAPVELDTHHVYKIENYGSAMAPFYTAVSLWVGGIVLAAMMKTGVADSLVAELVPVRLHELYLGRFCLFGVLALCQSTLMMAGELLFFGIQCLHPLQYLLAGWVGGLMFVLFIYTLTVSFGDIGKALAVVLLVMQVGGSGGTFPIEMTSPFFQAVYPFLPVAHLINAMHAAMAGGFGMEYWVELGCVALYFIPVLALGLLLRRPVIRANNWIIEKLEETHLM